MLPALIPGLTTVRAVFVSGAATPPAGSTSLSAAIATADPIDPAEAAAEDLYGIFYTGGTTAASKGVMLTHGNIVANAMNMLTEVLFSTGHRLHACRADVPPRRLFSDVRADDAAGTNAFMHASIRSRRSRRFRIAGSPTRSWSRR